MRMKVFIVVLFSSLVSNVLAGELMIPEEKTVIQFETKLGIVTFAHKMHAELSITQCTTCHHKSQPVDTAMKPCHECHQHKSKELAAAKKAFHNRCIGCHEYTAAGGQHAGPLKRKCKFCHVKPSADSK